MDDLVARLRGAYSTHFERSFAKSATDEIERLRAELAAKDKFVAVAIAACNEAGSLRAENAALRMAIPIVPDDCELVCLRKGELAALRADAERYRWLRDNHGETNDGDHTIEFTCDFENRDNLDAAIDAARKAS